MPPRISTFISTQVFLMQVVGGPQFKKHCSDRNLKDPIHRRSHTCESNISVHAKLLQLCPTLWDHMDWSLPSFSVHGILQARILEWVAIPSSRGSSRLREWSRSPAAPELQVDSLQLSHQEFHILKSSPIRKPYSFHVWLFSWKRYYSLSNCSPKAFFKMNYWGKKIW